MKRRTGDRRRDYAPSSVRRSAELTRDLLFPPRCVGCGDLLPPFVSKATVFCPLCRTAWETSCAEGTRLYHEQGSASPVFLVPYYSGRTDGVPERVIYHLKHEGRPRVFRFVAERLSHRVLQALGDTDGTVLFTYPPRRRSALREDGFDQAERLARALSETCGGKLVPLLCRTRRGRAEQKTLTAAERRVNAGLAYVLNEKNVPALKGRTVVLCDDLCTTGATLEACAILLYEGGAARVLLVTVARTTACSHVD